MLNFRLSFACVCLTMAILATSMVNAKDIPSNAPQQQPQHTLRDITVVKDIRNFARNRPGLKLLRMSKESGRTNYQSVRYTLGARSTGDRLIAQASESYAYPAKKDVTIQLTYPEAGTGSIVTYIEINCQQATNDGNAYVVAGGIGQRFISIVVEANQTENFSYTAMYYGSN